jgi:polyphenol oxidase
MNLGSYVGDDPAHVAANRAALTHATGTGVWLKQVHGNAVLRVDAGSPDMQSADASMTDARGVACCITVADCLPVLFASSDGQWVGAAHAGWRGLAGADGLQGFGIIEAFYESFSHLAQLNRASTAIKLIAWLGPCIGPTAFEVGDEVRAAFSSGPTGSLECFKPAGSGKYLADLPALARLRLRALGVLDVYGNDSSAPWCTHSHPSRFFSHRRDAAVRGGNGLLTTGRMAACIWRV